MNTRVNKGIDWNDVIDANASSRILLEDGNYEFEVSSLERSTYPGSKKLPACNVADLILSIITTAGRVPVKAKLYLCDSLKWQLVSFFVCTGLMKPGEAKRMPWEKVVGVRGRAHIGKYSFMGRDGYEHTSNEVIKFLEPAEEQNESADLPSDNESNDWLENETDDPDFPPF